MDHKKEILKNSKKRLQKLKLLSKFFDNAELVNIIIKTELLHSYFDPAIHSALDVNKLELFHLQYSDSLIGLLEKIKKQKEAQILAIYKEIDANEEYIEHYSAQETNAKNFFLERKYQNGFMSEFLKAYYNNLIEIKTELNIITIRNLSNHFAFEYYRKTSQIEFLLSKPSTNYYEYENIDVERSLLGRLNLMNFKTRFICGYNATSQIFELYRIFDTEDYFIWNLQTNEFYSLEDQAKENLDMSENSSEKKTIVEDLLERNKKLQIKADHIKSDLPEDVRNLLQKYKETIESQEIINQVINVDEEINILNSMLNLNLNNNIQ